MTQKIKIAFFITSTVCGGSETYLLRFLTAFKDRIEPTVFCKGGYEGELSDSFRDIGTRVKTLRMGYLPCLDFVRCCRELRSWNPDVVCDFTGDFSGFVMLSAKRAGIKTRIAQYRDSGILFKQTFFHMIYWKFVHWLTKRYATKFVSNSKVAFDFYFPDRERMRQKFEIVRNGVEQEQLNNYDVRKIIRAKHNIPESAFVVGHIGNYRPVKNHSVLVEAATRLCSQDRNLYFLLCGKGVEQVFGNLLKTKGLSSQVVCPGMITNVWEYLSAMDAFCFPSIIEGQSNALIEAMITNLPFVASNIPANQETVPTNLLTELVVPSDVDAYCEKILKIKNDPSYAAKFKIAQWTQKKYNQTERFEEMFKVLTEDV